MTAFRSTKSRSACATNSGSRAESGDKSGSAAGYAMDHTALLYLVDGDARIRVVFTHGTQPEAMAADERRLLPR